MPNPSSTHPVGDVAPPMHQDAMDPLIYLVQADPEQGSQLPPSILVSPTDGPALPVKKVVVNPYLRQQPASTGDKRVGDSSTKHKVVINPYQIDWSHQNNL